MDIIISCNQLQSLLITEIASTSIYGIQKLIHLKKLFLYIRSKSIHQIDMNEIGNKCTKLVNVSIINIPYSFDMSCFFLNNNKLKSIEMNGLCDKDILLLANCDQLTSCNLFMSEQITDESLIVLASKCHYLSKIVLNSLQNITIVSIEALATKCPIEEFSFINISMEILVPLNEIFSIFQTHCATTIQCIRIRDIRLNNNLITYQSIVDLLTICIQMKTLHLNLDLSTSELFALNSSFPTIDFIFE
jgi:hypothetical protein